MQTRAARLAIMLSGSGRTLVNLHRAIREGSLNATIELVIASKACAGVDRARECGVPAERVLTIPGVIPAERLGALLAEHRIDLVALCGYLKFVNVPVAFAGRVVNIHPALLPEFGGKGMYGHHVHEAVLASRRATGKPAESGCTVHLVDNQYDHGETLLQRRCPVLDGDTPDTLAARVFEQECIAYPLALRQLIASRIL